MKDPFKEAELLPMLKKILEDPAAAVEVKFSTLGLVCTLADSSMYFQHVIPHNTVHRFTHLFITLFLKTHDMKPKSHKIGSFFKKIY